MGVKKWNWLKKFMQVEVDMEWMQINFGGHAALLVLEIWFLFACLQKQPKFPFGPWTIKKGTEPLQKLLNKIRTEKE